MTAPNISPAPYDKITADVRKRELEAGVLGRFFGTGAQGRAAMVCTLCGVVVIAGVVMLWKDPEHCAEFWKYAVAPAFALAVGFIAGGGAQSGQR